MLSDPISSSAGTLASKSDTCRVSLDGSCTWNLQSKCQTGFKVLLWTFVMHGWSLLVAVIEASLMSAFGFRFPPFPTCFFKNLCQPRPIGRSLCAHAARSHLRPFARRTACGKSYTSPSPSMSIPMACSTLFRNFFCFDSCVSPLFLRDRA